MLRHRAPFPEDVSLTPLCDDVAAMQIEEPVQTLTVTTLTLWAQCHTCLDGFEVEVLVNRAGRARIVQPNVLPERANGQTRLRHARCGGLLSLWAAQGCSLSEETAA